MTAVRHTLGLLLAVLAVTLAVVSSHLMNFSAWLMDKEDLIER